MKNDLTDISYWAGRQENLALVKKDKIILPEWFYAIKSFLRAYEGKTFIELGCSPGYASAIICSQFNFIPFGIDFSPQSYLYKQNMEKIGYPNANLIISDIRNYENENKFDIVASFGLIEHFIDPNEIMFHHNRLAKTGGIIVMVIPNFTHLQWIYHFLFDKRDLLVHNTKIMNLNTFRDYSKRMGHKVLYLRYVGKLRFWGVDLSGTKIVVYARRIISRIIREFFNSIISKLLPANKKYYAPWIVYVGEKK